MQWFNYIEKKIVWSNKETKPTAGIISYLPLQQTFEDNAEINPIEIKIENDKIHNMFEKYKKNSVKFSLGGLFFSSAIKNKTVKIFVNKYLYTTS